jgi:hypothetical protein
VARQTRRDRSDRPLRRSPGRRSLKRTILVFTEGVVTEREYIDALKRLDHIARSTSVTVKVDRFQGQPLPLVERAVTAVQDGEIDEVWCLFDVEAPICHPNLDVARRLATEKGVHLAISNPCFELWLVLHEKDAARHLTTTQAVNEAQKLRSVQGKHLDAGALIEHRQTAAERAEWLRRRHASDRKAFPKDNPSTQVDLFVAAVEGHATS